MFSQAAQHSILEKKREEKDQDQFLLEKKKSD